MASFCRLRLAFSRSLRPSLGNRLQLHVPCTIDVRSLSTPAPNQEQNQEQQVTTAFQLPENATTAGKVLDFLNTQCKDELTNAHIQALIQSCESPADYPKLLHAITTFKRTRGYIIDTPTADALVEKVLSSSSPPDSSDGALWVLENFKERTGLYYSATVHVLDKALDALHQSILKQQQQQVDDDDDDDTMPVVVDKNRVCKALEKVTQKLIQRRTLRGARGLKKRAKREYLKCLQTTQGPTPRTLLRVAEIGVLVKTPEETVTAFVEPFQTLQLSNYQKTLAWVKEQEKSGEQEEESREGQEQIAGAEAEETDETMDVAEQEDETVQPENKE